MLNRILKLLTKDLDYQTSSVITRRVEAMLRTLKYMEDKKDERLMYLQRNNWTFERLSILFVLIAFYQSVLGPLDSARMSPKMGLGKTIPITYGNLVFDKSKKDKASEVLTAFRSLIESLGISFRWLQFAYPRDLVYQMSLDLRFEENE
jgi:hypothetical protein